MKAIREAHDEKGMRLQIEQIIHCLTNDDNDKGKVWSLVAYVLDHGRFYKSNVADVDRLKKAVLASPTMTKKMKKIVQAHSGPKSMHDDDEHLIIGSETYDHED